MPPQPLWFHRLAEIEQGLAGHAAPVLDRRSFEMLFRVGRRRALQIMQTLGGYKVGSSWVVERSLALEHIRRWSESHACRQEIARWERLNVTLDKARRTVRSRNIRFAVSPSGAFPSGVTVEQSLLSIRFASPQDLLEKIYAVVQLAASDFDHFEAIIDTTQELSS